MKYVKNALKHIILSFAYKVVDVFGFHLQIFHWFIAPSSRRYFQGHGPRENPIPSTYTSMSGCSMLCEAFSIFMRFVGV
jgi:hypothetical protein